MHEPGSALRNALAGIWCILVGAGCFLAQFSASSGNPVHVMDLVEVRLRALYLAFLALFALLALFDFWNRRRRPAACISGKVPPSSS